MEPSLLDTSKWFGVVGATLNDKLYVDLTSDAPEEWGKGVAKQHIETVRTDSSWRRHSSPSQPPRRATPGSRLLSTPSPRPEGATEPCS